MKVIRGCTPHALLTLLQAHEGSIERAEMLKMAHAIAGNANAGNNALMRLIEDGLVSLEYRITADGAKARQEAKAR